MGRIQRMKQGSLPSAVVATPAEAPSLADDIVGALGEVAKVGYGLAVKSEAAEMRKIAAADRVKQSIVDTVDFGALTTEFVVGSDKASSGIQEDNALTPDNATTDLVKWHEEFISQINENPEHTDAVKKSFATWSNAAKNTGIKKMQAWASKAKTENTKARHQGGLNSLNTVAASKNSLAGVAQALSVIRSKTDEFVAMDGEAWADGMAKAENDLLYSYASSNVTRNPSRVKAELTAPKSELAKSLNTTQRNTLIKAADTAVLNAPKIRRVANMHQAAQRSQKYFSHYKNDELTGETILLEDKELEAQLHSLDANFTISDAERLESIKIIKESRKDLHMLADAALKNKDVDIRDSVRVLNELNVKSDSIFIDNDASDSKSLNKLREFQSEVFKAHFDGLITKASFISFLGDVELANEDALISEFDRANEIIIWESEAQKKGGRQLVALFTMNGKNKLNEIFEQRLGVNAEETLKPRAMRLYVDLVLKWVKKGETLTTPKAIELAKSAFSTTTGQLIGGAN